MTFKEYTKSSQINENWLYTLAQVVDPTGALSYPDLIKATQKAATDPSAINVSLWALAAFAAMPNLGLLAAGVGGVPWAAAKAAAKGAAKNPKLLEKAGLKVVELLKKEPGKGALEKLVNKMVGERVITDVQAKALLGTIQKGSNFRLTKADVGALAKGAKGAGTYVPTKPVIAAAGTNVAGNIGKAAATAAGKQATLQKGTRLKTAARVLPSVIGGTQQGMANINKSIQDASGQQQQATGGNTVTYTDPKTGKQIQTTQQALQDVGIAPIQGPEPSVPTYGGRQLTPAQAQALGNFATPYIPGPEGKPGTVAPQNIPQGATPQSPFGREGMQPQQYMRPDNFNNPPNFFNTPQTYNYGTQQQYNPYNQQYGYGQPQSPVNAFAGLAGGLMNILPGIAGGGGMNPMGMIGMLPGLMGGM